MAESRPARSVGLAAASSARIDPAKAAPLRKPGDCAREQERHHSSTPKRDDHNGESEHEAHHPDTLNAHGQGTSGEGRADGARRVE